MIETDALIVGAGMSGMYQLHALRQIGLSVKVLEAGSEVGGTWYWNRYPGARFDSETYTYCYSFDKEILQEWNWSEHFAPQTETFNYLRYVADKLDLRRDIVFSKRVKSAHWEDREGRWVVTCEDGYQVRTRFLITAVGILSIPVFPKIPGRESFKGRQFHTAEWPRDEFDPAGKRIAVVGTGATGVQAIQELAKVAGHLTVIQKEPNWCKPLWNSPISADEMENIKANYDKIFETCRNTEAAFIHAWDPRSAFDVSDEEREEFFEGLYKKPGFAFWLANFIDTTTDEKAAKLIGEFLARKIRSRVHDPLVAERLIPKDHLFGTRRVPMETRYYEVFNQSNVDLIDINETPIQRIVPEGIVVDGKTIPLDVIVYATGFDAIRGAFDRIDIRGSNGLALKDKWRDGPLTFLGFQTHGFPNLFMLVGPYNGASFCNVPRCIEQNVEFVRDLIKYINEKNFDRCEAEQEAEQDWVNRSLEQAELLIVAKTDSWFTGVNHNVEGRTKRKMLLYTLGQQYYLNFCNEVVQNGYRGFAMSRERSHAL